MLRPSPVPLPISFVVKNRTFKDHRNPGRGSFLNSGVIRSPTIRRIYRSPNVDGVEQIVGHSALKKDSGGLVVSFAR